MIAHAIAVPADVDDVAVVDQPVDQSCRHHLVAEHGAPLLEALVGGEHGRGSLVTGVDELEEEHGAVLVDGQVVAFNPAHNVSNWVAYRLRREDLLKPVAPRKGALCGDPEVPDDHRVVKADYTGTGYDRGHFAPADAMKWSEKAMSESFFMTNMAPQVGNGFNRHIWKSLEQHMRRWACERGVLYVVTGPLYDARPIDQLVYDKDGDGVDDNGVLVDVPSHFFKLAYDPTRVEAIAFLLPNVKLETKDLPEFLYSIDDIEDRARLDVLPMIWDGAEDAIENHNQPRLWEAPIHADCAALG